jgi:RNA polymerase-binding protein DksA
MAKDPARQQQTDANRIGTLGTGKLDRQASRDQTGTPPGRDGASADVPRLEARQIERARERLSREREQAAARLRDLGITLDVDEAAPRAGSDTGLDEGDRAQASEREDMSLATRQRLADRINRLTAALARIDAGTYGLCQECARPIEQARLKAMPEAETCLACQERREREGRTGRAA